VRARAGYIVIALTAGVLFLVLRPHIQPYDSRAGLAPLEEALEAWSEASRPRPPAR
jgi:hypothetical protein